MKIIKKVSSLVLAAAFMLAPAMTASASDTAEPEIRPISAPIDIAAPARLPDNMLVYGTIESISEGSLHIVNTNEGASLPKVVVHVSERTYILNAVTGDPVSLDSLAEGTFVYAYINTFMALSMPPQSGAQLILCHIPADYKAPSYHTVWKTEALEGGQLEFLTDKGDTFTFDEDVKLTPFLTRNMVYLQNIVPGTRMLVWGAEADNDGMYSADKAMLFGYEYDGYFTVENDEVYFGREPVELGTAGLRLNADGEMMLPLRAVCEALGWRVDWDASARCAIVSRDTGLFFVWPGSGVAEIGQTQTYLYTVPKIIEGFTMVSIRDMATLLNAFYYAE